MEYADHLTAFLQRFNSIDPTTSPVDFLELVKSDTFRLAPDDRDRYIVSLVGVLKRQLADLEYSVETAKHFARVEHLLRHMVALSPTDPYPLILLAEHFHYYAIDIDKASEVIREAVRCAIARGELVRQALGIQIRIALVHQNYDMAEDALRTLVEFRPKPGALDVGIERDFLQSIPEGKINNDLIVKFRNL